MPSTRTASAAADRTALSSKAPPRPPWAAVAVATAAAVSGLVALVGLGFLMGEALLIPPLAASAALVYGAPALPLAQPRSVIGGQLLSACVGFAVHAVAGSSLWAAAVGGGLALGAMMAARTPHSPAAATTVIVVLTGPAIFPYLPLLALAAALLVLVGVLAARLRPGPAYPTYWW